jgi:hypothetical protein
MVVVSTQRTKAWLRFLFRNVTGAVSVDLGVPVGTLQIAAFDHTLWKPQPSDKARQSQTSESFDLYDRRRRDRRVGTVRQMASGGPTEHRLWMMPGILLTARAAFKGLYLDDRRFALLA